MNRQAIRFVRGCAPLAFVLLAMPLGLTIQAANASPATATVTILHGLPQFTADVYVNGILTLDAFKPETATAPLSLPAGTYDVAIRDVGSPPDSTPVVEATVTLEAGKNYSAIAHLTDTGEKILSLFTNAMKAVPAGKSRLTARDAADAPTLDVSIDGNSVFPALNSDKQKSTTSSPGNHTLGIVSSSDGSGLIPNTPLTLNEGNATIVYVVGSATDGTLDLMVQELTDLSTQPDVNSGSAGLAAPAGFPAWALALMVLAGVAAVTSVASVARDRRRSSRVDS